MSKSEDSLSSRGKRSSRMSTDKTQNAREEIKKTHFFSSHDDKQTVEEFDRFTWFMMIVTLVCLGLTILIKEGRARIVLSFVNVICCGSFYFASYLVKWIMARPSGSPEMMDIANRIKEGAEGYLSTQYYTIMVIAAVVTVALLFIYSLREQDKNQDINTAMKSIVTAAAFVLGSACSALAGYSGVWTSVRVNVRVSAAAALGNETEALLLAFRGGAVPAVLSAALCITGLCLLYIVSYTILMITSYKTNKTSHLLAGYGFGASFVALFMQLGGGIYTKAADVGADMVGKIEKEIPEDDPRNPAVIADLVGDNVGDCAGSMADVFESIAGEIIGAMILGGSLSISEEDETANEDSEMFILFPILIHALDLVVSSIGIMCVTPKPGEEPLQCMLRGYLVTLAIALLFFTLATWGMLNTKKVYWLYFLGCGLIGLVTSYLLIIITQYYTDTIYEPVKRIVNASKSGHGTNVIAGVAVGFESTGLPAIVIAVALLTSYNLGMVSGISGNNGDYSSGLFGTAVATMGMLSTAVFILSMNNFGPISDNAGGIVEMSGQDQSVRAITDKLDAVGNVTKAATKGYAVGGSALACFLLFRAFLDEVDPEGKVDIALTKVEVMIGGLMGVTLVFFFSGLAIRAVGVTAQAVVTEVRRQFASDPGIMAGESKPDYNKAVTIVTKAALKQMVKPALLAILSPILVGLLFQIIGTYKGKEMLGVEVLASFLMFGTLTGLLMAIFFDNSGGAWDNAKKSIEAGAAGGKGSLSHQAAITGDTVGDPFKDTAGPSLHVIITTMSTTALVLGPLFVSNITTTKNL